MATFTTKNDTLHVEIQSERLFFRTVRMDDVDDLLRMYGDIENMKYFMGGTPLQRYQIESNILQTANTVFASLCVFNKSDMSFIGVGEVIPCGAGEIEIGYILDRRFHGVGYATEIAKTLLYVYIPEILRKNILVENIPITKVTATAHHKNIGSWKILEKFMRFVKEADRYGEPRRYYELSVLDDKLV